MFGRVPGAHQRIAVAVAQYEMMSWVSQHAGRVETDQNERRKPTTDEHDHCNETKAQQPEAEQRPPQPTRDGDRDSWTLKLRSVKYEARFAQMDC